MDGQGNYKDGQRSPSSEPFGTLSSSSIHSMRMTATGAGSPFVSKKHGRSTGSTPTTASTGSLPSGHPHLHSAVGSPSAAAAAAAAASASAGVTVTSLASSPRTNAATPVGKQPLKKLSENSLEYLNTFDFPRLMGEWQQTIAAEKRANPFAHLKSLIQAHEARLNENAHISPSGWSVEVGLAKKGSNELLSKSTAKLPRQDLNTSHYSMRSDDSPSVNSLKRYGVNDIESSSVSTNGKNYVRCIRCQALVELKMRAKHYAHCNFIPCHFCGESVLRRNMEECPARLSVIARQIAETDAYRKLCERVITRRMERNFTPSKSSSTAPIGTSPKENLVELMSISNPSTSNNISEYTSVWVDGPRPHPSLLRRSTHLISDEKLMALTWLQGTWRLRLSYAKYEEFSFQCVWKHIDDVREQEVALLSRSNSIWEDKLRHPVHPSSASSVTSVNSWGETVILGNNERGDSIASREVSSILLGEEQDHDHDEDEDEKVFGDNIFSVEMRAISGDRAESNVFEYEGCDIASPTKRDESAPITQGAGSPVTESHSSSMYGKDTDESREHGKPLRAASPKRGGGGVQSRKHSRTPNACGPIEYTRTWLNGFLNDVARRETVDISIARQLTRDAIVLLEKRPLIQHVRAPYDGDVFVVGDLHGQMNDLNHILSLMKTLPNENLYVVFNGDFVDRGRRSYEVLLTVFALLLTFPQYVYLNRGNHEDLKTNIEYGFQAELIGKFGARAAKRLLKLIVSSYESMPLALVLNEKVFIVHGGLPRNPVPLSRIDQIKRVRHVPSDEQRTEDDQILVDLLWGDPVEQYRSRQLGMHHQGKYWRSSKRGCGVEYLPEITQEFLRLNKLKLVVRSHEVVPGGYAFLHGNRCCTVFSASDYSGISRNRGAVAVFSRGSSHPMFYTWFIREDPVKALNELSEDIDVDLILNIEEEELMDAARRAAWSRTMNRHSSGTQLDGQAGLPASFLPKMRGSLALSDSNAASISIESGGPSNRSLLGIGKRPELSSRIVAELNVLRAVHEIIYQNRSVLLSNFVQADIGRTGVLSSSEWADVLCSRLGVDLPWLFLRIFLVPTVRINGVGFIPYGAFLRCVNSRCAENHKGNWQEHVLRRVVRTLDLPDDLLPVGDDGRPIEDWQAAPFTPGLSFGEAPLDVRCMESSVLTGASTTFSHTPLNAALSGPSGLHRPLEEASGLGFSAMSYAAGSASKTGSLPPMNTSNTMSFPKQQGRNSKLQSSSRNSRGSDVLVHSGSGRSGSVCKMSRHNTDLFEREGAYTKWRSPYTDTLSTGEHPGVLTAKPSVVDSISDPGTPIVNQVRMTLLPDKFPPHMLFSSTNDATGKQTEGFSPLEDGAPTTPSPSAAGATAEPPVATTTSTTIATITAASSDGKGEAKKENNGSVTDVPELFGTCRPNSADHTVVATEGRTGSSPLPKSSSLDNNNSSSTPTKENYRRKSGVTSSSDEDAPALPSTARGSTVDPIPLSMVRDPDAESERLNSLTTPFAAMKHPAKMSSFMSSNPFLLGGGTGTITSEPRGSRGTSVDGKQSSLLNTSETWRYIKYNYNELIEKLISKSYVAANLSSNELYVLFESLDDDADGHVVLGELVDKISILMETEDAEEGAAVVFSGDELMKIDIKSELLATNPSTTTESESDAKDAHQSSSTATLPPAAAGSSPLIATGTRAKCFDEAESSADSTNEKTASKLPTQDTMKITPAADAQAQEKRPSLLRAKKPPSPLTNLATDHVITSSDSEDDYPVLLQREETASLSATLGKPTDDHKNSTSSSSASDENSSGSSDDDDGDSDEDVVVAAGDDDDLFALNVRPPQTKKTEGGANTSSGESAKPTKADERRVKVSAMLVDVVEDDEDSSESSSSSSSSESGDDEVFRTAESKTFGARSAKASNAKPKITKSFNNLKAAREADKKVEAQKEENGRPGGGSLDLTDAASPIENEEDVNGGSSLPEDLEGMDSEAAEKADAGWMYPAVMLLQDFVLLRPPHSLRITFGAMDRNHDNKLDYEDFTPIFKHLNTKMVNPLTEMQCRRLFRRICEEAKQGLLRYTSKARSVSDTVLLGTSSLIPNVQLPGTQGGNNSTNNNSITTGNSSHCRSVVNGLTKFSEMTPKGSGRRGLSSATSFQGRPPQDPSTPPIPFKDLGFTLREFIDYFAVAPRIMSKEARTERAVSFLPNPTLQGQASNPFSMATSDHSTNLGESFIQAASYMGPLSPQTHWTGAMGQAQQQQQQQQLTLSPGHHPLPRNGDDYIVSISRRASGSTVLTFQPKVSLSTTQFSTRSVGERSRSYQRELPEVPVNPSVKHYNQSGHSATDAPELRQYTSTTSFSGNSLASGPVTPDEKLPGKTALVHLDDAMKTGKTHNRSMLSVRTINSSFMDRTLADSTCTDEGVPGLPATSSLNAGDSVSRRLGGKKAVVLDVNESATSVGKGTESRSRSPTTQSLALGTPTSNPLQISSLLRSNAAASPHSMSLNSNITFAEHASDSVTNERRLLPHRYTTPTDTKGDFGLLLEKRAVSNEPALPTTEKLESPSRSQGRRLLSSAPQADKSRSIDDMKEPKEEVSPPKPPAPTPMVSFPEVDAEASSQKHATRKKAPSGLPAVLEFRNELTNDTSSISDFSGNHSLFPLDTSTTAPSSILRINPPSGGQKSANDSSSSGVKVKVKVSTLKRTSLKPSATIPRPSPSTGLTSLMMRKSPTKSAEESTTSESSLAAVTSLYCRRATDRRSGDSNALLVPPLPPQRPTSSSQPRVQLPPRSDAPTMSNPAPKSSQEKRQLQTRLSSTPALHNPSVSFAPGGGATTNNTSSDFLVVAPPAGAAPAGGIGRSSRTAAAAVGREKSASARERKNSPLKEGRDTKSSMSSTPPKVPRAHFMDDVASSVKVGVSSPKKKKQSR